MDEGLLAKAPNGLPEGPKAKSHFYANEPESPDGFSDLPREAIAMGAPPLAARESVIRLQMAMREDQYTELQPFRVFTGTWNVNGQAPSVSLGECWLSSDPSAPDIYAIGFQELDLSKEAFLFNDTPREDEWLRACSHGLHPNATYVKVKLIRLIGMMLIVFVKKDLEENVTNIAAETVGTGILGKMGNKGGVAIRFDFFTTSLCFVNCHLAAHVEEYERRNQDYNEICSRLVFTQFKPPKFITDHDQVYWFGDLNYRITEMTTDQVKKMLEEKAYASLLRFDQFKLQHDLKKVFAGYVEGEIRHMPTYKYDPGTDNWDSSDKNRPPAWCDRILWKGGPTKLLCYRSHPRLKLSDHKPVSALFVSSIKVIDNNKYRKIYKDVMKKLDRLDNEFLPQVTVDKMEVTFDSLSFRDSVVRYLTIANTGQVPVRFEFIKKPNQIAFCKEWLRINPYTASIMPGDKVDVELEVFVDKTSAPKLNFGLEKISDILVLHLEQGRDLFITITGSYRPSCFGSSLSALVRMKCPIRDMGLDKLYDLEKKNSMDRAAEEEGWDIPKEVWLLVDQLYKYGMTQQDLFQQPGLHSEFRMIRDALDSGWPEKLSGSIHSIAEALLILLEALSEPVIPYAFYQRALDGSHSFIICKQIINEIPDVHRHVFYYLIAFTRELLRHSNYNKLEQRILATVFGGILLRAPLESPSSQRSLLVKPIVASAATQQSAERKKAAFVFHFLINDFDV